MYDRVVPNNATETLWVLTIGIALVLLFDLTLKILRGYFIDFVGRRADLALSSALFARVMDLRLDQPRQSPGTLANNLREFESLREFFTSATLASIIDLPFVLMFIAVILWIGGIPMVLPTLVGLPVVVVVGLALQPALRDHIRRSFAATEAKYSVVIETVAAIEHVKHLNAASQLQRKWEGLVDFVARESLTSRLLSSFALNFTSYVQAMLQPIHTSGSCLRVGVQLHRPARTGQLDVDVQVSGRQAGRFLGPFDQTQARFAEILAEAGICELIRMFEAIKIKVIQV